ncbi:hypothetical protein NIASO_16665 [Niabella soli DSM 19437]|uniref:Uncharacterized protein n=2 Tax=Niabella TaxID=379899 RepID=W0EZW7_9BACT|nr:hypothetical protein NIASO_16665 [Niabella soli DSM 19437]
MGCNQTGSTKKSADTLAQPLPPTDSLPARPAVKKLQDSLDAVNRVTGTGGLNKAFVSLKNGDSTITLHSNIRQDHRIFGYARPDTNAERLLLFSVFTNDVQGNPFKCRLGSYYETSELKGFHLKYLGTEDSFIKAMAIDSSNNRTPVYFEKKWIDVE